MKRALLFALLFVALPAGAMEETPLSPSQFREYSEGYTLHFSSPGGENVGSESFSADGKATWQFPNGTCIEGVWKPHGAQVCFYYGFEDEVQCWRILRDAEGLLVRQIGEEPETYRITGRDRKPLLCGGPSSNT